MAAELSSSAERGCLRRRNPGTSTGTRGDRKQRTEEQRPAEVNPHAFSTQTVEMAQHGFFLALAIAPLFNMVHGMGDSKAPCQEISRPNFEIESNLAAQLGWVKAAFEIYAWNWTEAFTLAQRDTNVPIMREIENCHCVTE